MSLAHGGMGDYERSKPHKRWWQWIQCQVCEEMIKQVSRQSNELKNKNKNKKIKSENDIMEMLENICDPWKNGGIWITQMDLIVKPPKLEMKQVTQTEIGDCRYHFFDFAISHVFFFNNKNVCKHFQR